MKRGDGGTPGRTLHDLVGPGSVELSPSLTNGSWYHEVFLADLVFLNQTAG